MYYVLNKWKHFRREFLLWLRHLLSHCFSLLSAFFSFKSFSNNWMHCESLIATLTYFLFKCNWKNKTWKELCWCQSFGSQTSIPVSQTARILPCIYQWSILLKYWSPKHSLLITENSLYLAWTWNAYYAENKKLESS